MADRAPQLPAWAEFLRIGVLAGLLVAVSSSFAQTHNFHHYDTDDGLMQAQVLAVHQDQEGYLWTGSYGGISRYVGHSFYNYTTRDGLADNVVEAIASDDEGRLWAGTTSGLCQFRPLEGRFECMDSGPLQLARIHALHAQGPDFWVGTDRGLFRLVRGRIHASYGNNELPSDDVRSIVSDSKGRLWIGTSEGLVRHDRLKGTFESVRLPVEAGRMVTALLSAPKRVWVGTERGLYWIRGDSMEPVPGVPEEARHSHVSGLTLDANGKLWAATSLGLLWERDGGFLRLTTAEGLPYEIVFSITTDHDGLIWFGHDGGLSKWIPSAFVGYRDSHGLLDSFVRTMTEDHAGRLWLGTRSGVQIVPGGEDWIFQSSELITRQHGLVDERVFSIDFPLPGTALIATGHGVAEWRQSEGIVGIFTDDDGLPVNQTQALLTDRTGQTWIGTNSGTVVLRDGRIHPVEDSRLGQTYVYRFREDQSGRVWAASRNGLFIRSPEGTTDRFHAGNGLSDATLWDLAPDGESGMWVGSNGDGLFHVEPTGAIRQFTEKDGLVDNFVWQVLVDGRGHVWAYTNRGLARFDGKQFQSFNRYDGLLHLEGGATGALESRDGTLWFASANGLMRYDPNLVYPQPAAPRTLLERVELEGAAVSPGQVLSFRPGTLDFHYAALSFRAVSDLQYRYRLRGISDNWSEPISYRPITFASLGSGKYDFEVQARLPEMEWDKAPIDSFPFTVQRAYWETPLFWSLTAFVLAVLMLLMVRWQTRRTELHRRQLAILVRERTRELERVNRKLESAAITDPLTGLHNRRFLLNQIDKDVAQSLRAYSGQPLFPNRDILFMMCDLDHFKKINDKHGHLVGDYILREFSTLIMKQLRESDYLVRWGGEEFLVVARQAEANQCGVIADRILEAARTARFFPGEDDTPLSCTCSIGICHFPFLESNPEALNWEQVVDIADTAVYMAKHEGRDRWVAIHGTEKSQVDDDQEFVTRVKTDITVLSRSEQVWIERPGDRPRSGRGTLSSKR